MVYGGECNTACKESIIASNNLTAINTIFISMNHYPSLPGLILFCSRIPMAGENKDVEILNITPVNFYG
jgi:hypothetical protein